VDSQIEEIKNKLNVLDIVSAYVKLTKTGVNYRGVCPFHSEKGPSFFVSPARQMWHCFGCGAGGDIFEFIKKIESVEFGEALRILAQKAGVELKRQNPQISDEKNKEKNRLYEICELACIFFEKQLQASDWGKKANEYLLNRGLKLETIKKWRIGYSPDTWQGLSDFLVGRGYSRQEILKAGLAVQSEKGKNPYDRFRGRIIFPIFDQNSRPIGFGARVFKEADKKETAKYINTPQTPLYDKSSVLYGINFAKIPIRRLNQCVLTEGYMDAIMCHQAGFENTVAVSGTALTEKHLPILKRYTDNLLLSFDMDSAGDNATKRSIELAESQGFNLKVINIYNNAKDPAEIILENSQNWENSVKNSRGIMDYYFDSSFSRFDKKTVEGRMSIQNIILPAIKRLQNKIEQSHWIEKLAQKLQVKESSIIAELANIKVETNFQEQVYQNLLKRTQPIKINDFTTEGRKKMLEERIVSLILKNPYNLNLIKDQDLELFSDDINKFFEKIKKESEPIFALDDESKTEEKLKAVFADISNQTEHKIFFDTLALKAEVELENEGPEEIELCLCGLKDIRLRNILESLSLQIAAEEDQQKIEELKTEFNKKAKELHCKN